MPLQVLMCHTRPIQLRPARNEDGTPVEGRNGRTQMEVIPGHPVCPATGREDSTWWEPVEAGDGAAVKYMRAGGAIIREV